MKNRYTAAQPNQPRRRVLGILAATSLAGLSIAAGAYGRRARVQDADLHQWRGTALGADSTLLVHHPDRNEAARLTALAVSEIERLEKLYSLKRNDSLLVQLNHEQYLDNPPPELVSLLTRARAWSDLTGGAFDITVQPLWKLYSKHFSRPMPDPAGPSEALLTKARHLVNYRAMEVTQARIKLAEPGMAVTLNGIAQGEITDRVVRLLKNEGISNSLVDLGEMRALGSHPGARPWHVGIKNPYNAKAIVAQIELNDRALATSSVTGTVFEPSGRHHHLFNPKSGLPGGGLVSASVIARRAVDADALSTAMLAANIPLSLNSYVREGIERVISINNEGVMSDWVAGT